MATSSLGLGVQERLPPFAVPFCLLSGDRFRLISLVKMMSDFMNTYTSLPHGHQFDVASLCYRFAPGGAMGIMFFDVGLNGPFQSVLAKAREDLPGTTMFEDHPVTYWPLGKRVRCSEDAYQSLLDRVR